MLQKLFPSTPPDALVALSLEDLFDLLTVKAYRLRHTRQNHQSPRKRILRSYQKKSLRLKFRCAETLHSQLYTYMKDGKYFKNVTKTEYLTQNMIHTALRSEQVPYLHGLFAEWTKGHVRCYTELFSINHGNPDYFMNLTPEILLQYMDNYTVWSTTSGSAIPALPLNNSPTFHALPEL